MADEVSADRTKPDELGDRDDQRPGRSATGAITDRGDHRPITTSRRDGLVPATVTLRLVTIGWP